VVLGLASAVIAQSLPVGAKSAENLYKSKVKQADATRDRAVGTAKTQLVTTLKTELKKALAASNLKGANAIQQKIDEYSAPVVVDTPATARELVGRWRIDIAPGRYIDMTLKSGGAYSAVVHQKGAGPRKLAGGPKTWRVFDGQFSYANAAGYTLASLSKTGGKGIFVHSDGREIPWTWTRVK